MALMQQLERVRLSDETPLRTTGSSHRALLVGQVRKLVRARRGVRACA